MAKQTAIDEWELFVPDMGDNRERFRKAPETAITCEIHWMCARRIREYDRLLREPWAKPGVDPQEERERRIFCENVRNIRNYAPCGKPLTTPEEVFEEGEMLAVNTMSAGLYTISRLKEGLAKNLSSQCDLSTSLLPKSGNGDARAAIQKSPSGGLDLKTMATPNSSLAM